MSEETILILNMLRDGKLTVDDAERLLGAVAPSSDPPHSPPVPPVPPVPPIPPMPPGPPPVPPVPPLPPFSSIVAAVQSRLGDLQGRLGNLQGDIIAGAAAAYEDHGPNTKHGNWGKFDFGSVLDETVRDLNSLRTEAMRTAKRAVREAAVQGRAAAQEARQAARRAETDLREGVRFPGFGGSISIRWTERPHNAAGLPEVSDTIDIDEPLGECVKLRILNPLGSVRLIGGGVAGAVHGRLQRTVWAGTREEAEAALSTVQAVFHIENDTAVLEVPFPGESQDATADLEVTVPSGLFVEAETLHGDLRVEGAGSAITAKTQSGDIDARNAVAGPGDALFHTASGDLRVEDWDVPSGALTLQTTTGDVTLRDANVSGGCRVVTQSGDVLVEAIEAEILDAGTASGDIRLISGTVKGTASARSQSGSIRLEDLRAAYAAVESVSGEISLRNSTTSATVSTTSGDVEIAVMAKELTVKTVSGDADIQVVGPFTGSLLANTVSGDLKVALPDTTGAWFDAATTSGDIESQVPLQDRQSNDSRRLAGRIGTGSGTVRLRTISGDISVEPSNYP